MNRKRSGEGVYDIARLRKQENNVVAIAAEAAQTKPADVTPVVQASVVAESLNVNPSDTGSVEDPSVVIQPEHTESNSVEGKDTGSALKELEDRAQSTSKQ